MPLKAIFNENTDWLAMAEAPFPFIAAESDLSSQEKPQLWKVISFQSSVEEDSSILLQGTLWTVIPQGSQRGEEITHTQVHTPRPSVFM